MLSNTLPLVAVVIFLVVMAAGAFVVARRISRSKVAAKVPAQGFTSSAVETIEYRRLAAHEKWKRAQVKVRESSRR